MKPETIILIQFVYGFARSICLLLKQSYNRKSKDYVYGIWVYKSTWYMKRLLHV